MPVRLTVVIVQTPPSKLAPANLATQPGDASGIQGGRVDAVVGELLGLPEIDLTLINRLEAVSDASTDQLTLEGIAGDMVVLDWQTPEQTCQSLATIKIAGVRWPHKDDPVAVVHPGERRRRFYAFDLRQFALASAVRESISQLLAAKQVKTVSFSLGPNPKKPISLPTGAVTVQSLSLPETEKPGTGKLETGASETGAGEIVDQHTDQHRAAAASHSAAQLDALVDQLDEFDQ